MKRLRQFRVPGIIDAILLADRERPMKQRHVSDKQQKLDRQIAALKKAGCKKIFYEKQSAKSTNNRPELEKAIQALSPTSE